MEAIFSREEEATYGCYVCLGRGWVPCLNLSPSKDFSEKTENEARISGQDEESQAPRVENFAAFADSPKLQFPFSGNNSFIAEIIQP